MSENQTLSAALRYARRGFLVFPCHSMRGRQCSCGQAACPHPAKHPRTPRGFKDATTNEQTLRTWWQRWPDANVAIPTGAGSGIVVIDTDHKPDQGIEGEETLSALEKQHGALPETVEQITGGGGHQRFFRYPGVPIPCSTGTLGPGIDIRGDGGYVLVPPSTHESGRVYEWELSHHPDDTPLADLSPAWVALLQSQSTGTGSRAHADTESEPIREGQRNDTLFRLARSMRVKGMSHEGILAALSAENSTRCRPPLSEAEVRQIAESASAYQPGRSGGAQQEESEQQSPWQRIKDAKAFALEERKRIEGIAKDILFPGVITMITGPKGIGKSLIGGALAVASTVREGVFRGERVRPVRVLYLDRENPEGITQARLLSWGVLETENFHILTREQDPPLLTNRKAWAGFPIEQYDVLILDAVGSFSEGVTERRGKIPPSSFLPYGTSPPAASDFACSIIPRKAGPTSVAAGTGQTGWTSTMKCAI